MRDGLPAAMASHRNSVALHAQAVASALAAASNNASNSSNGAGGGAATGAPGGEPGTQNADVDLDGVDPRGRAFTHPDEYMEMTPMRVEGWMAKQGHIIRLVCRRSTVASRREIRPGTTRWLTFRIPLSHVIELARLPRSWGPLQKLEEPVVRA